MRCRALRVERSRQPFNTLTVVPLSSVKPEISIARPRPCSEIFAPGRLLRVRQLYPAATLSCTTRLERPNAVSTSRDTHLFSAFAVSQVISAGLLSVTPDTDRTRTASRAPHQLALAKPRRELFIATFAWPVYDAVGLMMHTRKRVELPR